MGDLPNSPAQLARLRAIAQRGAVGTLTHRVAAALDIRGTVAVEALQAGVDHTLRRRPALRSVFRTDRDTHQIAERAGTSVRYLAVAGDTASERWREAHRLARAEAHRPLPIGRVPLLRATLFDTGDRQLFLLTMDQLACDAWTANLVVEDVVSAADRAAGGLPPAPAEPDEYELAWRARSARIDGPTGQAAVARRRAALAGHRLRWPLALEGDRHQFDHVVEERVDLDQHTGVPFLERVRVSGGSVLSATALAFAAAHVNAADRVVLTSTFACRESEVEAGVGGWFSNEVAIPLPPLVGSVSDALRALRVSLAGVINDQAAPHSLVVGEHLAKGGTAGLSVSLLYLPSQLIGGERMSMHIGATVVERCHVSICPTGSDIDLYVAEGLNTMDDRDPASLNIGAMSSRTGIGRDALAGLLSRWRDEIVRLGRTEWLAEPLTKQPSGVAE